MRLGLVINPIAGLGGPSGLKGSDAPDTLQLASARGVSSQVYPRLRTAFRTLRELLADRQDSVSLVTVPGLMGADFCAESGFDYEVVPLELGLVTSGEDTKRAVASLIARGIDLLVFGGGDGTARDVFDAAGGQQVVLGIPCGVKMHSAVFANNPSDAAQVIYMMASGELVTLVQAEVRDIDEAAFRQGQVRSRFYGEMHTPLALRYMQQVKSGGREVELLVLEEIAAEIAEQMLPDVTYFMGSGSTVAAIMAHLGLPNTLLGIDVIRNGKVVQQDAFETQLFEFASAESCRIVLTVIGGQGHLFGRGNQQLSPRVIRAVGLDNILVVATKSKLEALSRGIVVDTGDPGLDKLLTGFRKVITGYGDAVLCPVRG